MRIISSYTYRGRHRAPEEKTAWWRLKSYEAPQPSVAAESKSFARLDPPGS